LKTKKRFRGERGVQSSVFEKNIGPTTQKKADQQQRGKKRDSASSYACCEKKNKDEGKKGNATDAEVGRINAIKRNKRIA